MKLDGSELIGLTESEAKNKLKSNGSIFRIVERDGESFAITMDLRYGRFNLYIKDDKVVKVKVE